MNEREKERQKVRKLEREKDYTVYKDKRRFLIQKVDFQLENHLKHPTMKKTLLNYYKWHISLTA